VGDKERGLEGRGTDPQPSNPLKQVGKKGWNIAFLYDEENVSRGGGKVARYSFVGLTQRRYSIKKPDPFMGRGGKEKSAKGAWVAKVILSKIEISALKILFISVFKKTIRRGGPVGGKGSLFCTTRQ